MHTDALSIAVRAASAGSGLGWNPLIDVQQLFQYPFMVNAFRAGTIVAVVAGALGWFMVLRRQAFAGHTIALVGFPGAAGATLVGISVLWGYFGFCVIAALVISAVPHSRGRAFSQENAVTGTVQALLLAFGYLFVSLYAGNLNGIDSILFGSFLGITDGQVVVLLAVAVDRAQRARRRRAGRSCWHPSTPTWPWPRACPSVGCPCSSWSCSAWPPPRPARSPAPCSCSPCW